MSSEPRPYQHYRPDETSGYADGVYRVVGVDEDTVTLLEVADSADKRVNSGRVVRASQETVLATFDDAPNPDEGLRPRQAVDWITSSLRMVVDWLR